MAEDLNEVIEEVVSDADVMTVPIDDTLTISGEAADAKAVGDALALKADKSEIGVAITVNGEAADEQGRIIIDASEIEMVEGEEVTVAEAISEVAGRTAEDIQMTSEPDDVTISEAIGSLSEQLGTLSELETTAKTSLVDAVNEVNARKTFQVGPVSINKSASGTVDIADFMTNRAYIIAISSNNASSWNWFGVYYATDLFAQVIKVHGSGINVTASGRTLTIQNTNSEYGLVGRITIV